MIMHHHDLRFRRLGRSRGIEWAGVALGLALFQSIGLSASRPVPAITLHVAPKGRDDGTGSSAKPFASLERARDEVRNLRSAGRLAKGGVTVMVHGGEYMVKRTFTLTTGDSGSEEAPILYVAAPKRKTDLPRRDTLEGMAPADPGG